MQAMHKRALLYGGASLLLSGIGYAWATHSADADAMTLLSSADVQLRLAYAIPALDKQGKALPAREEMITQAEKYLADVERIQPGMAVTAEFVGFAHSLRGRFEQAAAAYGRARQCQDCGDEQRDVLAFNQARMLAQGGKLEQALASFTREAQSLDRRFGHQRSLEETTILRQLGRPAEAEARLSAILNDAAAPPMASLQAGLEYLELGKPAAAEQALTRAAASVPIADYHLARLKLQAGDVDTCLGLLERVAAAQPAEVRRRLREEAGAWSAVSADARFQELVSPRTGTPVR
jgi:tetratricopeptide (TPR) repeat protein